MTGHKIFYNEKQIFKLKMLLTKLGKIQFSLINQQLMLLFCLIIYKQYILTFLDLLHSAKIYKKEDKQMNEINDKKV